MAEERGDTTGTDSDQPELGLPGGWPAGLPGSETARLFGSRSNRRARLNGALKTCRLCWRPISIEAQYIEEDPPRVYFRCPHCAHSFPIRRSDIPEDVRASRSKGSPAGERVPEDARHLVEVWAALEEHAIDKLDLGAVRALLAQVDNMVNRLGPTEETRVVQRSLRAREQILAVLEQLEEAIETDAGQQAR
jgi:hypothetical protein